MKHELFPYFYTRVLYSHSQFYWAHGFRTLSNWITNGLWFHVCRKLWVLGLIHNQQTKYDSIFSTEYEISYFCFGGVFSLISLGLIIEIHSAFFLELIPFILQDRYEITQSCSNDLHPMVDYAADLCIRLGLGFFWNWIDLKRTKYMVCHRIQRNLLSGKVFNIKIIHILIITVFDFVYLGKLNFIPF